MPEASPLSDIAHVIQLSVAPVFLLVSLGTFINILSLRLARIVDRARALEERPPSDPRSVRPDELSVLRKRRKLVNIAITFGTFASLLVCVLIASAFIGSIVGVDTSQLVAGLFITAMIAFTGVLITFLAEIRLSLWHILLDTK